MIIEMKTMELKLHKIAIPIFFETLLFMLLGVADTLMLTRYGTMDQSQIAVDAVGMCNQILHNVQIFFGFISAGTAVLVAQNIGAGNKREVKRISLVSLAMNLMIGLLFSIALVRWGHLAMGAMGLKGERLATATAYMTIVGGFMAIQAMVNTMTAIIRSHGDTRITFRITLVMNILNVIGDAVFIFGFFGAPVLGVRGVAIATTGSRVVAFIIMLWYVFTRYVSFSEIRLIKDRTRQAVWSLLSVGVPSAMENMSYNVTQIIMAWIVLNHMSDVSYKTRVFVWQITWFLFYSEAV